MTRPLTSLVAAVGAFAAAGAVATQAIPAAANSGQDKPTDSVSSHDPQGLDKEEGIATPPPGADALAIASAADVDLAHAFPESFAGMWVVDEHHFNVAFSEDPGEQLQTFLGQYFSQRTQNLDAVPTFHVVLVERSMAEMSGLQGRIAADARSLEADGFPDVRTYVDPKRNKVVIQTSTADEESLRRLADRYGPKEVVVRGTFQQLVGSRTNDSPAWNGGNKMIAPDGAQCTTGFGAHAGATRYLLSAGHCGNRDWFNTSASSPAFGASRHLGHTTALHYLDGHDMQKILADGGSSKLFWKGSVTTTTREAVSDSIWPSFGQTACSEGATSGESCGSVVPVPQMSIQAPIPTVVEDAFEIEGCTQAPGDSGAPVVWPSGYGYMAVGVTISAGVVVYVEDGEVISIPICGAQEVKVIESILGVSVNSIVHP